MTLFGLIAYILLFAGQSDYAGGFRELSFTAEQDTTFGDNAFRLVEPNRPAKPTVWEGPLIISSRGKSCSAEVSLVTAVYASTQAQFVIAVTYSGSSTFVHFITIATCAEQWKSFKVFTEGVRVVEDRLSILPACDGLHEKWSMHCYAGRVYKLSNRIRPTLLRSESFSLTKETLGVGFTGEAKVANPKSPWARIVPKDP